MHELGLLRQVIRIVGQAAEQNRIKCIRHITLEVGNDSGVVPQYMKKLFPIAADAFPLLKKTELRISMVCGSGLVIKEIGY